MEKAEYCQTMRRGVYLYIRGGRSVKNTTFSAKNWDGDIKKHKIFSKKVCVCAALLLHP